MVLLLVEEENAGQIVGIDVVGGSEVVVDFLGPEGYEKVRKTMSILYT